MIKRDLLKTIIFSLALTPHILNAQANLFVTIGDSIKHSRECIPFADSIFIADSSLFVVSDTKVKSYPYKNVMEISVSVKDSIGDALIPKSMSMIKIDKIPYLHDLSEISTTAESIISDSSAVGFDDFIENTNFGHIVNVKFGEDSATVTGLTDNIVAIIDKNYVTVTSKEKNVKYILTGATKDGGFKLYGDNRSCVTLNEVDITSKRGAAINIQSKKRCFVVLEDNTANYLYDAKNYYTPKDEDEKAAFFSEGQLCFSGKGQLHINALKKSALASDEYIRISDGVLNLYTSKAKGATLKVKENLIVGGGYLQARADGDAGKAISSDSLFHMTGGKIVAVTTGDVVLDSDNSDYSSASCIKVARAAEFLGGEVDLMATGVGGKGINVGEENVKDNDIVIDGSTINVLTLGKRIPELKDQSEDKGAPTSSPKGIKSGNNLKMKSGMVKVNTLGGDGAEAIECKRDFIMEGGTIMSYGVDDGINAVNSEIYGGRIFVASSANDGFDANGGIYVNGGELYCLAYTEKQAGIDNDGKTFGYNGGTIISVSEANSAPWSSKSNGCSVMAVIKHAANYVAIKDAEGNDVIVIRATDILPKTSVLIASPLLKQGEKYAIFSSMEAEGAEEDWGVVKGATLVDPIREYEFEFNELTVKLGSLK